MIQISIKSGTVCIDGLMARVAAHAASTIRLAGDRSSRLAILLSLTAPMDITANDFRIGQFGVVCRLVH
jgi:hypothetical protein